MEIRIKETGELKELVATDQDTGCEWTANLIEAGQMEHDEDGNPVMEQDDFDWWVDIIERIKEVKE